MARYPLKLAGFWTAQGLWGWICLLPVSVAQALGPGAALGPVGWLAAAAFAGGFATETLADYQKFVFKSDPANKDK
jgi:steroid 5-alpha reductase family enzyme